MDSEVAVPTDNEIKYMLSRTTVVPSIIHLRVDLYMCVCVWCGVFR